MNQALEEMVQLAAFLMLTLCAATTRVVAKQQHIYIDKEHGTLDNSCWTGGEGKPCKSLDLAVEGVKETKNASSVVIQLVRQCKAITEQEGENTDIHEPDNEPCATWHFRDSAGVCQCGDSLNYGVYCNSTLNLVGILDCNCMTYYKNQTEFGSSFYGCFQTHKRHDDVYNNLPLNVSLLTEQMCGRFNRTGRLCGACKPHLVPLVYSYNMSCVNCTGSKYNNIVKYISAAFIPLTAFYFLVVILRINATSPQLHSFIIFCQALSSPINIRCVLVAVEGTMVAPVANIILAILGVWNLDFFRTLLPNICLKLNSLQVLALDYSVAFYPLLLIALTFCIIKLYDRNFKAVVWACNPLGKCIKRFKPNWDIRITIIHTFATFLYLSHMKILNVSFDLLIPTEVKNVHGNTTHKYLYYDATIAYFGKTHLPYAIVASVILLTSAILPAMLMLLYPMACFQKVLNSCRLRTQPLHMFMDYFQGHYKDGTDGTRDFRYFAAFYFITRVVFYTAYAFSLSVYTYAIGVIILIAAGIFIVICEPYKPHLAAYNKIDAAIILTTALWFFSVILLNIAQLKAYKFVKTASAFSVVIIIIPLAYITILLTVKAVRGIGHFRNLASNVQQQFREVQGYSALDDSFAHRVDNPELYNPTSCQQQNK